MYSLEAAQGSKERRLAHSCRTSGYEEGGLLEEGLGGGQVGHFGYCKSCERASSRLFCRGALTDVKKLESSRKDLAFVRPPTTSLKYNLNARLSTSMTSSCFDEDAEIIETGSTAPTSVSGYPRSNAEGPVLVEELLTKCENLLWELEDFRIFVAEAKSGEGRDDISPSIGVAEQAVDLRQFHTPIVTEYKSLQKLSEGNQEAEKTIHTLKSSNLPFYAAIWEAAKASKALVLFHKRFYWDTQPTRDAKRAAERRSALVDIVSHDGEEWIKISTVTEHRLLFELAKAQWEEADSSDSESEDDLSSQKRDATSTNFVERMDLVGSADDLQRASQAHRVRYSNPRVRIVLPKISDPPPSQLLPLLNRLRSTGAILDLSPPYSPSGTSEDLRRNVFPKLLPSPHPPLTSTLNIDCTILLALVSDLSHTARQPILPSYNGAIRRQIELETKEHLLPSSLWPAMASKALICTTEAARRMREIVSTIGTPNERARTESLLESNDQKFPQRSADERRAEFAKYSDYSVPTTFFIPIKIVPSITSEELKAAIADGKVLPIAESIADELTEINRSVFLYGWCKGFTTVSSNRAVAKWIESTIEKTEDGGVGPEIWLREPARSLLGKEKERRK